MRLFVVLSPVLSGLRPGDLVTAAELSSDQDDDSLDRAVERGYVAEVFHESTPADDDDGDEHPPRNASREDWAAYADARGVDVEGLGRDDIIDLLIVDDD